MTCLMSVSLDVVKSQCTIQKPLVSKLGGNWKAVKFEPKMTGKAGKQ